MKRARVRAVALAATILSGTLGTWLFWHMQPLIQPSPHPTPSARPGAASPSPTPPARAAPAGQAAVYLHYYLWWTPEHWREKLGAAYPYVAASPPLPGRMDASGCNPRVGFPGVQIVDLPSEGLYDQGRADTFDTHISLAAAAGVSGFLASWQGTGDPGQTPRSSGYDTRLDLLVSRVDTFDQARPGAFGLALAFEAFDNFQRPAAQVIADLDYFAARYGGDPAFRNHYSAKPIVMWLDSRKFPAATVEAVSAVERSKLYLLGDETPDSWARDAPFLDATSYYWSSENPWQNRQAGAGLSRLAGAVRAGGKRWFAPFIAGYDKQLLGGGCVPRRGTETLREVWAVNSRTRPDGWFGISWNELVENTYLEPSRAYGSTYLDTLAGLIRGARPSPEERTGA